MQSAPSTRLASTLPALGRMTLVFVLSVSGCRQAAPTPGPGDPIRPNGVTRSREEIVAFMEFEVMPFARRTLGPLVGPGNVRCETCHGADAEARNWQMPAVAALPEQSISEKAEGVGADSQVRNALHGYSADPGKERAVTLMRSEVLPGMAALLRRPAYDFAQPYAYNVERGAFGCYHCHRAGPQSTR